MKITIDHELELSPRELAEEFCELDCEQQARFFSEVQAASAKWDSMATFQWHDVASFLTSDGTEMIDTIHNRLHSTD